MCMPEDQGRGEPSRTMDLPSDLKHLFLKWLEDDCIVQIQLGSKRALQLTRAMENLKRTDEAIDNVNKLA